MRVLIIGGTRFVGKLLVKELLYRGCYDVTLANRHGTSLFGTIVKHIPFDRKRQETYQNLEKEEYDVVVDMIAYSAIDVELLLKSIKCSRYIMISSSVVYGWGKNHAEKEFEGKYFDPLPYGIEDLGRKYGYKQAYQLGKMSAEAIVATSCPVPSLRIRFPLILGVGDHTKRIESYIHGMRSVRGCYVDNITSEFSVIRADNAAKYLADLIDNSIVGVLNLADEGTLTMGGLLSTLEEHLGVAVQYNSEGEVGGYNGYYTNTFDLAQMKCINFLPLHIDGYISELLGSIVNEELSRGIRK